MYDTARGYHPQEVAAMSTRPTRPLDQSLVGHITEPETGVIRAEAVREFAAAIGDENTVYRDESAARAAGYRAIPVPPTFVTRYRVPFHEAGLDPEHMQVLHAEQEYVYNRPLFVGDELSVRHTVASLRQSRAMSIMTIEQIVETTSGGGAATGRATGRATVIVREGQVDAGEVKTGGKVAASPEGEQIPPLEKRVTQAQIDAYADASGDHNPIHINPEAARAVGLPGTIAHGMLSMGFLGQLLTNWTTARPSGWIARLRVRFQAMVFPGDTLTCHGVLRERQDERQRLELWIDNQRGERVLTGDAEVALGGA
jgi:acyl dehydratase